MYLLQQLVLLILARILIDNCKIIVCVCVCGLFELVSSLESSPEGTGKAVAITRSSPREKATGLKAPAEGRRAAVSRPHSGGSCAACRWPPASARAGAHTPQPGWGPPGVPLRTSSLTCAEGVHSWVPGGRWRSLSFLVGLRTE